MKIINISDKHSLSHFLQNLRIPSLVRLHSNSCGYCHSMIPEWKKLLHLLKQKHNKDNLNVVDIESEHHEKLPSDITSEVIGYPTILALNDGKVSKTFQEERTSDKMYDFCKNYLLKSSSLHSRKQSGGALRKHKSKKHKSRKHKSKKHKSRKHKSKKHKSRKNKSKKK